MSGGVCVLGLGFVVGWCNVVDTWLEARRGWCVWCVCYFVGVGVFFWLLVGWFLFICCVRHECFFVVCGWVC